MMNTNLLALASGLSDPDLLARLAALAGREREASVELVAHLAELDTRSSLYAAQGHGSLFTYCTEVLRFSQDAACNRIYAARACRRLPVILDALASGALSLTSVRMLSPHLTPENHDAVLARASGRSRREVEALVAELAPRPDVPSSVRKLPGATPPPATPLCATDLPPAIEMKPTTIMPSESAPPMSAAAALPATAPPAARRPIVETTSPERYRVQFTIGMAERWRPMRLRQQGWTPMHRARLPGVASHPALRTRRSDIRREHLAALPAPQPIAGRLGFRSSHRGHRGRPLSVLPRPYPSRDG